MALTVFADVLMPSSVLAAGVRGKQRRQNTRAINQAGFETININWSRTLREYEIGFVPMLLSAWSAIEGLHEVTEGGAYGFLLSDPKDNTVLSSEGVMTLITSTTYQLQKRYTSVGSTRYKDRNITRPISAGLVVYVNGTSTTVTVNTTTGIVTFATAPGAATLTWAGSFYVPVHFQNDEIDWQLVRSGNAADRLMAGPAVVLMEVRE